MAANAGNRRTEEHKNRRFDVHACRLAREHKNISFHKIHIRPLRGGRPRTDVRVAGRNIRADAEGGCYKIIIHIRICVCAHARVRHFAVYLSSLYTNGAFRVDYQIVAECMYACTLPTLCYHKGIGGVQNLLCDGDGWETGGRPMSCSE